jgi:hypothetical protein
MTQYAILFDTLDALFTQSRDGRPDVDGLAHLVGACPQRVAEALSHLERRGLVDAQRARLTLRGLAVAAALHAEREAGSVAEDASVAASVGSPDLPGAVREPRERYVPLAASGAIQRKRCPAAELGSDTGPGGRGTTGPDDRVVALRLAALAS